MALQERVTECINDVATWMRSNRLQLNAAKKFFGVHLAVAKVQLPDVSLTVGSDTVKPVRCVCDLGIYLDSDISMRTRVSSFCCAASDHKQTTLGEQTTRPLLLSLVASLILSRLDNH